MGEAVLIKGVKRHLRKAIPKGTCCEYCETGRERNCPHWNGIHSDDRGEGLSSPGYCPKKYVQDFDPIRELVRHGSGTQGWQKRVMDFFSSHTNIKERAKFLSDEYYYYGFGRKAPKTGCYLNHLDSKPGKGVEYNYSIEGETFECFISYKDLALAYGKYLDPVLLGGSE